MQIEISTGYSVGQQRMPDIPREGDILHQAEFTYRVAGVVWKPNPDGTNPMFPRVSVLPLGEVPILGQTTKDLWPGDGFFYSDNGARSWGVPRVGDLIDEDGEHIVAMVEWFLHPISECSPPPGTWMFVRLHLAPTVIADHPGLKAVTEGANAYGRQVVTTGVSPM